MRGGKSIKLFYLYPIYTLKKSAFSHLHSSISSIEKESKQNEFEWKGEKSTKRWERGKISPLGNWRKIKLKTEEEISSGDLHCRVTLKWDKRGEKLARWNMRIKKY